MIGTYQRDSITWLQHQGRDAYGVEQTPTETTILARVNWKVRRVTNSAGNEVVSAGDVILSSKPLTGQDRLRIDGSERLIVATEEIKSFSRVIGYRAFIQ